jgi:copper transport protein
MNRSALLALVALGVLAAASRAGAHALLNRSDPPAGATLQRAPQAVTLTFTEEPEPTLSSVRILLPSGQQATTGPLHVVPGAPRTLGITLGPLGTGVYSVNWRTVSRVDGHVTGGVFAFGVGTTPADIAVPEVTSPPPSPLGAAARWGLYAGLSVLLGATWVWTIAFPRAPERAPRGPRLLWLAWLVAVLGIIGLAEAQRSDAGAPLRLFLGTSLGRALGWRALPLLAVAGALAMAGSRGKRLSSATLIGVGAGAAGTVLAHVAAGHAAAGAGPWRPANVAVQWVHVMSVGAWLGGLAALLSALGATPDAEKAAAVRRFSTGAGILLVLVAATGTVRAVDEVGGWNRLATTPYGRLVLLKAGLLLLLALLGSINRFRSVPAAVRTLAGLRRVGIAELAVAALTLAVASVLTQTAPANFAGAPAATAAPLVATGSDFGTSVRVRLEAVPGFPGPNQFTVSLRDYDTGHLVAADRVSLRFTAQDRPDVGASTLTLARRPDGAYDGQGSNLSLEGRWNVAVVVERGINSAEVPLALAVHALPQRIHSIAAPGQPTLYSIELSGGRVLDTYLDPGRPGFNELHATYIDAAGHEIAIPQLAAMTASRPGGAPVTIPVRRFGPGHFIGDAQLGPGEWLLNIAVTTSGGEVLQGHLSVRL